MGTEDRVEKCINKYCLDNNKKILRADKQRDGGLDTKNKNIVIPGYRRRLCRTTIILLLQIIQILCI